MEPFNVSMNLLCSSLRHNGLWAPAVTRLLQSQGTHSRWRETPLGTHDLALSSPGAFPGTNHVFRFLLLCPNDLNRPETSHRVQQLHRLEGGRNAAILFLVDEDVTKGATHAFTKLQIDIPSLPIIPLPSALALAETLQTFQAALAHSSASRYRHSPGEVARDLLPHCAVGRPLSERTTAVLMESCHSIKGVVEALADERGEDLLVEALGGDEAEAGRLLSFWRYEFGL